MNMSLSAIYQMPMNNQLKLSEANQTKTELFGHLMARLTGVVIDEHVEEATIDPLLLQERIDQLTEEQVTELISWLETEFEVVIEDEQQLIEQLQIMESTILSLEDEENEEMIQQMIFLFEQPVQEVRHFENFNKVSYTVNDSSQVLDEKLQLQSVSDSLNYLFTQFDSLTQEDANQFLAVLKQIQQTNQPLAKLIDMLTINNENQEKLTILTKVYDNFENKAILAQKTSYQTDTIVTSKDIQKWVKGAIEEIKQSNEPQNNSFGELFSQQKTNTTIEQLNIHLGQDIQTSEQVNEQLLTQFEKVMSQSRFMQQLSGDKQLLLKLTPESLGTIRVELTEVGGEMLVKLTATSQMAKEALEANAKELRHMFAPQNIVIEKQELEPTFVEQPPPQEEMHDNQNSQDKNQHQNQPGEQPTEEEKVRFEDVLFQERV